LEARILAYWSSQAEYSKFDSERAKKYFGATKVRTPSFFPILSLLPQRALGFIKANHPELFVQTFLDLFTEMWEKGIDVSKPNLLASVLSKRFSSSVVKSILEGANSAEYKQLLNDKTKEALGHGAFGCPWFWVTNSKGEEEPFFGSDRCVRCFPVSGMWRVCSYLHALFPSRSRVSGSGTLQM
jgi:glutathione S-transferase kappa 1